MDSADDIGKNGIAFFPENEPDYQYGIIIGYRGSESGVKMIGYFGNSEQQALENMQKETNLGYTYLDGDIKLIKQEESFRREPLTDPKYFHHDYWNRCQHQDGVYPAMERCGMPVATVNKYGTKKCKRHSGMLDQEDLRADAFSASDRQEAKVLREE